LRGERLELAKPEESDDAAAAEAFRLGPGRRRFDAARRGLRSLPYCSTALYDRAAHTYGKSFRIMYAGLSADYSNAPNVVAYSRTEEEVAAVLDWAGSAQATVTPFGGGSSVVGGVEPRRDATRYKAAVTKNFVRYP
jgi:alkyldihydroxyacetonephosphate synthase